MSAPRAILAAVTATALALTGLLSFAAPAAADPLVGTDIGTFETADEGWATAANGATGGWERVAPGHTGDGAANLHGDFPTRNGFVEFYRGGLPAVEPTGIRFWVKATGVHGFSLRMIDADGQTHQRGWDLDPAVTGWQQVDLTSLDGWGHWGGTDDGIWRGAAQSVDIILDSWALDDGATAASLLIDDVQLVSPAPALLVSQTEIGNVFIPGEPTAFDVTTSADTLSWKVTDIDGAQVAQGSQPVSGSSATLTVGDLPLGWYTIAIDAVREGAAIGTVSNTFARVATPPSAAAAATSTFAISTHLPGYVPEAAQLVTRAGVANVRDDLLWQNVEPSAGSYDFSAPDHWFGTALEAGIKPLFVAAYGNQLYDDGHNPTSDAGIAAYGDYVLALIGHYGGNSLGAIEIYNEWDLGLDGSAEKSPQAYVKLLKAVYPRIKAAYPGIKVIGPANAHWDTGWLETAFQLGALQYVDGVDLHPYSFPGKPEGLDTALTTVKGMIAQYNGGQQKPIWITEMGWPSGQDGQSVSAREQSDYNVRAQLIAAAQGVAHTYTYVLVNEGVDPVGYYPNLGMMHNPADPLGSLTPKQSYVAFATMTAQLTGATFQSRADLGDGVWALRFRDGATEKDALWSTKPAVVDVLASGPVTLTGEYGTQRTLQPAPNGRISIALGSEVQYVTGGTGVAATQSALTLQQGFIGAEIAGSWVYDNRSGTAAVTATLAVDGRTFEQTVAAGAVGTKTVALAARSTVGPVSVAGTVSVGAAKVGALTASTTVIEPIGLSGTRAVLADGSSVLRLRVLNRTPSAATVTSLTYTALGASATKLQGASLAGNAETMVDVPIANTASGTWTATVTIGSTVVTAEGTLAKLDATTSIPFRTVKIDGTLDAPGSETGITLPADGIVTMPASYGGAADLGGKVYLDWDAAALYLSAKITDDTHAQFSTEGSTWNGDSVQLGISRGAPGDRTGVFSEFTAALTPDGPQLWRGSSPTDPTGFVAGAQVKITRDETGKTTTYEVAIPWERLDGIRAADRILSASLVVNDNDGTGRDGWIEWGQGIATSKDPTLFKAAVLAAPPLSTLATLKALAAGGTPVAGFDPTKTSYTVALPYGTATAPKVTATATDPKAKVTITQAANVHGTATVKVVSADRSSTTTYSVAFTTKDLPECTRTLTGTVKSLVISSGVTCLDHATVKGAILVTGHGGLVSTGSTITGTVSDLASTGPLILTGGTISGTVSAILAKGEVRITGVSVTGLVLLTGNRGGVTVAGSTVKGSLACSANTPAPTNAGSPNTVTKGGALGQCKAP